MRNIAERAAVAESMAKSIAEQGKTTVLIGPPGVGKTMIARRVANYLPAMTEREALEVAFACSSYRPEGYDYSKLPTARPFRAPHHSVSEVAMRGNKRHLAGEILLSNHGVLFLDELPEFGRPVIAEVAGAVRDGTVRPVGSSWNAPAGFLLVASANPCPCGWLESPDRACVCTQGAIERYQARLFRFLNMLGDLRLIRVTP